MLYSPPMQAFDYYAPSTLSAALDLLRQRGETARPMAGGTDLIVQLREGRKKAGAVVDLKHIPELNALSYAPQTGLEIGAAVALRRIYTDSAIAKAFPGLMDAFSLVGGTAIQGRASVGGNLCTSSPAADTICALIAHSAVCVIAGATGLREVAVEDFNTAPGRTVLQNGELLVSIKIPAPPAGFGAAYLRFIPRNEMDIAEASSGASVVMAAGKIVAARVALGAVAPRPLFVPQAGAMLMGQPPSESAIESAARAAEAAATPITDMRGTIEHRKQLAYVLTKRALTLAIERSR